MRDVVIAVIQKNDHFALLRRVDDTWTFPSGKCENGESLEDAVIREVQEEAGLNIDIVRKIGARERDGQSLHYFLCNHRGGNLTVGEPDKFRSALWLSADRILDRHAHSMFEPVQDHIRLFRKSSLSPQPMM